MYITYNIWCNKFLFQAVLTGKFIPSYYMSKIKHTRICYTLLNFVKTSLLLPFLVYVIDAIFLRVNLF